MTPLHSLATAAYAAIGAVGLTRPDMVPALFGGTAPTADARNEVRAVYGGLTLAMAAVGVKAPAAVGVLTAGMAAARAGSIAVEPRSTTVTKAFVGIEVALAGAYAVAARQRGRAAS